MIYIVIPCYNCEDTLEQCVQSIVKSVENIDKDVCRIVLVYDESDDLTPSIMYSLAQNIDIVSVVYYINAKKMRNGPGRTRNIGFEYVLNEADQNDYVWFIDADDYIEENTFCVIYDKAINHNPDIIMMSRYDGDTPSESFPDLCHEFTDDQDKLHYIQNVKIIRAAWDKLYKISCCETCRFTENTYYDEESLFTFMALLRARTILSVSDNLYHYRMLKTGLTKKRDGRIEDNLVTWECIKNVLKSNVELRNKYPELIKFAFKKNFYDVSLMIADKICVEIDSKRYKELLDEMIEELYGGEE